MQTLRIALVRILCLVLLPFAATAADFEGTITMKVTEGRQSFDVAYATRAGQMRITMAAGPMGEAISLVDLEAREMKMLMPQQKMYMVMPFGEEMDTAIAQASPEGELRRTDETETILGYLCTKYVYDEKQGPVEIWGTDKLGQFVSMPKGNMMQAAKKNPGWENAIKGDFFPLRVVALDKKNKQRMRWEVTAIQPQKLGAEVFAVPADYRKFDMGGLMQGLGGLMKGN